ncbi:hypothetical protein SAMN05880558_1035 [Aeromonas sp. RU39B]|uniref:hypothetical protein n=1 Tax=Aeromonas sp. RU39B TaxID=1907416 RepID=UPI000954E436|nr:hypothetical protein [Aeromonas sp. RU39B]SIQ34513.1 hypothetical protein SAMN05880558_1035 [Aeromonas sp. RU39B]
MADMSPIDLLRRYEEHSQELRPLLLGLLAQSPAELARYPFVLAQRDGALPQRVRGPMPGPQGRLYLLVEGDGKCLELSLHQLIAWLMGDRHRRLAIPWFKLVYVLLSAALMLIVGSLVWHGLRELLLLLQGEEQNRLGAFSAIVFLTLALAVFDLGKTILEEEVLLHKDIFRHSTIRRTITRFIAAILIAVSIEGLLLLFKGSLGQSELLWPAVGVMGCAVGLLLALGLYVFLGARAEALLVSASQRPSLRRLPQNQSESRVQGTRAAGS